MKTTISNIFLALTLFVSLQSFSKSKVISITCSEPKAKILVNGLEVGTGTAKVLVKFNSSIVVEAILIGFSTSKNIYFYDKSHILEKSYTITLYKDESYEGSISGENIANENININSSKDEDKAWKVMSEVVTTSFDILETSDKSTGYIRTSWQVQSFDSKTIRTRIIVKGTSTDSKASYKIKIISEVADKAGVSVKEDDMFKPWDRILKKYSNIIPELQDRLK